MALWTRLPPKNNWPITLDPWQCSSGLVHGCNSGVRVNKIKGNATDRRMHPDWTISLRGDTSVVPVATLSHIILAYIPSVENSSWDPSQFL